MMFLAMYSGTSTRGGWEIPSEEEGDNGESKMGCRKVEMKENRL